MSAWEVFYACCGSTKIRKIFLKSAWKGRILKIWLKLAAFASCCILCAGVVDCCDFVRRQKTFKPYVNYDKITFVGGRETCIPQKAMDWTAKGRLLGGKRWPMRMWKVAFCKMGRCCIEFHLAAAWLVSSLNRATSGRWSLNPLRYFHARYVLNGNTPPYLVSSSSKKSASCILHDSRVSASLRLAKIWSMLFHASLYLYVPFAPLSPFADADMLTMPFVQIFFTIWLSW